MDAAAELPHRAFYLRVAGVADHDEFVAFQVQLCHFNVDFGDQRAGCVKNAETALFRLILHRFADAVGGEHQR